jgi:hypothetical protein
MMMGYTVGQDNGDGTGQVLHFDDDGTLVRTDALVGLPIVPPFPPLNATGALATLLVVENVLSIDDAANAIHEEPAHLIHEAESWSVG